MTDYERIINESGFIPTEQFQQWESSLNESEKKALDDYFYKLWSDAYYDESVKQMEVF